MLPVQSIAPMRLYQGPIGSTPRFISPKLPSWAAVEKIYREAYKTAQITNGSIVGRFEDAAARYLNVKHCVAVSSCTSGLILVMKALDLQGEVIVPSFTFFASGMAILWAGLRPVYADCNPETWTLDAGDVSRRITRRTAAILGVHLYGNPCQVESLAEIAAFAGAKLLFDAAHAFGSSHYGRPIGGFGDAEVFSLSPTKLLVAGEGGLVATNDAILARRLKAARNYGDLGAYDPELQGMNARMTEFNASMALAGLEDVQHKVKLHNRIARTYTKQLFGTPGLGFQTVRSWDVSAYKDYSVVVGPKDYGVTRDELADDLRQQGVETKKYFYPPLHQQKLLGSYRRQQRFGLQATEHISNNVLSLPIHANMSVQNASDIADAIRGLAARTQ